MADNIVIPAIKHLTILLGSAVVYNILNEFGELSIRIQFVQSIID
jgi:hypothetical protein